MRIVVFGDIHMHTANCRMIPDIQSADCLVLSGDLTNFGGPNEAARIIEEIKQHNSSLLAQLGNLDKPAINAYFDELGINLHGQARLIGDICLFGVGGSNATPFHTPTEFDEDQLARLANQAYEQARILIGQQQEKSPQKVFSVFISHTPPAGTKLDLLAGGKHVGSPAIREFIAKNQPDLCICGHIHEAKGEDIIGSTTIINPGMFQHGGWVEIISENGLLQARLK